MKTDFTVGKITAKPGEMVSGFLDEGIPVTVVNGRGDGPVLALVAGNHGYEYPPILALQMLRARLTPKKLAGAVILVHAANMPSFLGRTVYFSPIDQKNLNRVYPGKKDGTVSDKIAYAITNEVIARCDYLLDLHCGDGNESLRPYNYQIVTSNEEMNGRIAALVTMCVIDHIVVDRGRPADPENSMYCSNTAITRGKPAVTVEAGFLGVPDEKSARLIVECCENVMRYLKIASGKAKSIRKPVYLDPAEVVTSPETGILYPKVKKDDMVKRGTTLAVITDFFGKKIAEVKAPVSGKILYIVATPPISKGQPIGCVGVVRK
ncbi:MAG: succinylglutamate desuccinylase/aspartoacylase family protein [Acidobacteriia bacterium]|nr:succinylglutamate desuccinylase/aspartoacylase family protein [Terriglobia bacterium]